MLSLTLPSNVEKGGEMKVVTSYSQYKSSAQKDTYICQAALLEQIWSGEKCATRGAFLDDRVSSKRIPRDRPCTKM